MPMCGRLRFLELGLGLTSVIGLGSDFRVMLGLVLQLTLIDM